MIKLLCTFVFFFVFFLPKCYSTVQIFTKQICFTVCVCKFMFFVLKWVLWTASTTLRKISVTMLCGSQSSVTQLLSVFCQTDDHEMPLHPRRQGEGDN